VVHPEIVYVVTELKSVVVGVGVFVGVSLGVSLGVSVIVVVGV
jgi:small basic protein